MFFPLLHPGLRADFTPLRALGNFPQNLLVQLTSFAVRDRERETVRGLIEGKFGHRDLYIGSV